MHTSFFRRLMAVATLCLLATTAQATFIHSQHHSTDHSWGISQGTIGSVHHWGGWSSQPLVLTLDPSHPSVVDWSQVTPGRQIVFLHSGHRVASYEVPYFLSWQSILAIKHAWLAKLASLGDSHASSTGGSDDQGNNGSQPSDPSDGGQSDNGSTADVPAPSGLGLFVIGLALMSGLLFARRRRMG